MKTCKDCKQPRLAGQAFTNFTCPICKRELWWHNTGIPKVCMGCAENNDLCMRCGKKAVQA